MEGNVEILTVVLGVYLVVVTYVAVSTSIQLDQTLQAQRQLLRMLVDCRCEGTQAPRESNHRVLALPRWVLSRRKRLRAD